jgi:hypothetical protein
MVAEDYIALFVNQNPTIETLSIFSHGSPDDDDEPSACLCFYCEYVALVVSTFAKQKAAPRCEADCVFSVQCALPSLAQAARTTSGPDYQASHDISQVQG